MEVNFGESFIAGIERFLFEHSRNFFKNSTGNNLIVYCLFWIKLVCMKKTCSPFLISKYFWVLNKVNILP
jgi:hypothetical protein